MRLRCAIPVLLFACGANAEILDRIAASVGKDVITQSAVIQDLRVGAFLDRMPVDVGGAARRRSAERLVDQILMLREAEESRIALPGPEAVRGLLQETKKQFANEAEYQSALKRYGVTESDVLAQLESGLRALSFRDLRFRPAVQISDADIRASYDRIKPNATLEDSRDQIEELLTQQRTTEALDEWLKMAREAGRVVFHDPAFEEAGKP